MNTELKIAIIILLSISFLVLPCIFIIDKEESNANMENKIIQQACSEINVNPTGSKIKLVYKEPVKWAEGDLYLYILTTKENKSYYVGVRRDKDTIYCVDLEKEI